MTTDVMTSGTPHEGPPDLEQAHEAPPTDQVRIVGAARAGAKAAQGPAGSDADDATEIETATASGSGRDGDDITADGRHDGVDAVPEEPQLLHWTEAPTGEIPAVLSRGDGTEDVDPWASLPRPSWREEQRDWEQEEPLAPSLLGRHAALPPLLPEVEEGERQPWSFDLGAVPPVLSPDEHLRELDDLVTGELFADRADRAGRADHGDHAGRASDELGVDDGGSDEGATAASGLVEDLGSRSADAGGRPDLFVRAGGHARAAPTRWHVLGRRGEHADAVAVAADADAATGSGATTEGTPPRAASSREPARNRDVRPARRGEDALSQRAGRNMPAAIGSGIVIGGLALILFHFGSVPSMVIVTVVLTAAAIEAYAAFRKAYRPATLLGIVAVAGVIVGSYDEPLGALPVVAVLLLAATILWHLVGVDRRADPVRSTAATLFVFVWIGIFGSFAALLLAPSLFPHRTGIAYFLGAVIAAVAYDVGALAVGASVGRHPLGAVSPGKTWEGVIGGAVAAIVFAVAIVPLVHPWTMGEGAALGIVVAVVSPIGDLCESLVKRQLGLKDMGRILPGHGGLLDRVDGLLFVLPATYYLLRAFGHG
ncbi:MAG: phosphatidate cytidylyltransferase [Acidimicrobiales bacterium]